MPAIPKYLSRDRQNTSQLVDINEPIRTGQIVSNAIGNVGEGLFRAQQAEQIIDEKISAYNEKKELQNAELQFVERSQAAMFEAKDKFRNNPKEAEAFLNEQKNSIRQDLLSTVQSPIVKDQFSYSLDRNFLEMDQDLKTWQIRQTVDNAKQSNAQMVITSGTKAYEAGASGGGLGFLNQSITDISLAAETSTDIIDQAELDKYKQVGKQQVILDYGSGLLDNNYIGKARELLKSKEHRDLLGADGISRLTKAIDQKEKQNLELQEKRAKLKKTDFWFDVGPEAGLISFNYVADPEAQNLKTQLLRRNAYLEDLGPVQRKQIPFLRASESQEFKVVRYKHSRS
jgi:hypothetical protein